MEGSKLTISEIKFNFNEYISGPNQPNPRNDMSQWIPYLKGDLDKIPKLSKHHIIPNDKLRHIKDYKCRDNSHSAFCTALLANEVKEFCGAPKFDNTKKTKNKARHSKDEDFDTLEASSKVDKKRKVEIDGEIVEIVDEGSEECKEQEKVEILGPLKEAKSEKHPPFVWETGNLFYGPNKDYRTDDTKCKLDTKVLPLMDCLFSANMPGTRLKLAYNALTEYNKSIAGQNCSSQSTGEKCIKAARELNEFYQEFCSVKDNPLYDSSFYLRNFWEMNMITAYKAKFNLKKDFDCNTIRFDAQHAPTEVLRQESTLFLQKDAMVSDHFHKTETVDSSNSRF